jgi:hypothetical protein
MSIDEQSIHSAQVHGVEPNEKGLIDLSTYTNDNFTLFGFSLSRVLDDILLVKYADLGDETGETVIRNGIMIPIAHVQRAWRIGQVVLAGPLCKYVKVDDYVCFPSDKGIPCSSLDVEKVGTLKDATFLNEARIFGICRAERLNKNNDDKSTKSKKRTVGKRSRNKV